MEKTIKSTIAPNPREFTHWTDFSADPYGNIIRSWTDFSADPLRLRYNLLRDWDGDPNHQHITLTEKERLALMTNYDDTTIIGLINALTTRVTALEQAQP